MQVRYKIIAVFLVSTFMNHANAGLLDDLKKIKDDVKKSVDQTKKFLNGEKDTPKNEPEDESTTKNTPLQENSKSTAPAPQQKTAVAQTNTPADKKTVATNTTLDPNGFNRKSLEEQSGYYDQFPFDKGSYEILDDPTGTFRSLYIPTYKGKPRLGLMPKFDVFGTQYHLRTFAQAFSGRLQMSARAYVHLCAIKENKNEFTKEKLAYREPKMGTNYTSQSGFEPFIVAQELAYGLLKPDHFTQYFCDDSIPCPEKDKFRGYERTNLSWGGSNERGNEFAIRRAQSAFFDNEMPKLIKWSESLSCDVATVLRGNSTGYDFSLKAVGYSVGGSQTLSYPVAESEAQALLDRPRKHMNSTTTTVDQLKSTELPLYAVVNTKLRGDTFSQAGHRVGYGLAYELELNNLDVSFYADDQLTDKIADLSFTEAIKITGANGSITSVSQ